MECISSKLASNDQTRKRSSAQGTFDGNASLAILHAPKQLQRVAEKGVRLREHCLCYLREDLLLGE